MRGRRYREALKELRRAAQFGDASPRHPRYLDSVKGSAMYQFGSAMQCPVNLEEHNLCLRDCSESEQC